jgi:hypothetical protein
MIYKKIFRDKLCVSYLILVGSLILHVIDEAINHFLDFFNLLVIKLKEHLTIFPFPVFTFKIWITGLTLAIIILIIITRFIQRRNRFAFVITRIFAVLMIINGLGHIAFSIYYKRIIPGMLSSPVLIFFSIYFIYQVQQSYKLNNHY